jgi:hypothetical protein
LQPAVLANVSGINIIQLLAAIISEQLQALHN